MNQNVLTLPASGTSKIIYEHKIHAFPSHYLYKETPYVAFRERGGFVETIYTVRDRLVLMPPYNPTSADLTRFDLQTQERILTYIQDRKKGFGFEKPGQAYMFWILELETPLPHRPKVTPNTPGRQYFSYEDFNSRNQVITKNGSLSKTGVFEYDNFRDNLLLDKYNPILSSMRSMKTKHLRSENSEDALTWNVFQSLQQINPNHWYTELISKGINQTTFNLKKQVLPNQIPHNLTIKLWESIRPSLRGNQKAEGATEVDVMMESDAFVWFIEAKFKSDISTGTTHDQERNQILRNLDVGSYYAKGKDFYFSLLILDDAISSKGVSAVERYSRELTEKGQPFENRFSNVQGLTVFYWSDFVEIFKNCMQEVEDDFEQLIAARAFHWMTEKVDQLVKK
ncbi:hypothetical protein [Pseudalkalibacillus hwajinpoensis]|uniref:hypothetical protein n=1 Tax=Guptibacillus hwajinpoensis TaxID=208199 RepID=UPI001CFCEFDE|nr:hypothetical protein [Pseudalkalibacillus hwajinpoensis]